jgi:hypothetical protein
VDLGFEKTELPFRVNAAELINVIRGFHATRIKRFLEDPRNEDLRGMYYDAADELKGKIITSRHRFITFNEVLTYLYDEIIDGSTDVRTQRQLVRVFLHYMYFDCDIGRHA